MKVFHALVFLVVVQSTCAFDFSNIIGSGEHEIIGYVVGFLGDLCPNVNLSQEAWNFGVCVSRVRGSLTPSAMLQQLCTKFNQYVDCSKPLIASLKSCNNVKVNDFIKVTEGGIEAAQFACANDQLPDILGGATGDCLQSNFAKCSQTTVNSFLTYSQSKDSVTYFTADNCRELGTALKCTTNQSSTCAQQKSIRFFQDVSNIILDKTCSSAATSGAPATLLLMIVALLLAAGQLAFVNI